MTEAHAEVSARPVGGRGRIFLRVWWGLAIISGVAALALAGMGWFRELGAPKDVSDGVDIAVRTIKVLLLSDIYYDPVENPDAAELLEHARALGVLASLLVGLRLLVMAIGSRPVPGSPPHHYRRWSGSGGIRIRAQPHVQGQGDPPD
jgi:hypothetical protein